MYQILVIAKNGLALNNAAVMPLDSEGAVINQWDANLQKSIPYTARTNDGGLAEVPETIDGKNVASLSVGAVGMASTVIPAVSFQTVVLLPAERPSDAPTSTPKPQIKPSTTKTEKSPCSGSQCLWGYVKENKGLSIVALVLTVILIYQFIKPIKQQ